MKSLRSYIILMALLWAKLIGVMSSKMYSFTAAFGKESANKTIPQKDIDIFLNQEVRSRFDSFTLIETTGWWKELREKSFMLFVLDSNLTAAKKKISDIAFLYKKRFSQESVLMFYSRVTAYFL